MQITRLDYPENDIAGLIAGCKKNNRKAQEQLYKGFYGAMAIICARYTRDQQDIKEVLNDGFLKVFKNIGRYDQSRGSLYTWIRTIMINASIDFLRRQHIVYTDPPTETGPVPEIENTIIQQIDADHLLMLIRRLPPATQLVFNLYTIEGFNHREIGQMLQISEGTSKWHLSEARKQLREVIQIQRK